MLHLTSPDVFSSLIILFAIPVNSQLMSSFSGVYYTLCILNVCLLQELLKILFGTSELSARYRSKQLFQLTKTNRLLFSKWSPI